ncbi:MAG: pyridoxamine 5'-phosphate oxidase family protein [Alphaproteobacteria bacterium]|jgi:pyridoxamine 5'-phosphate oxidase|nr:pyridoxamine 5'-phosphate oxidase family protein [Alphaproteobacteria bacterium]
MAPDQTNDLNAALAFAHEALEAAAGNRTSPARLLALATVGLDGRARARTVMMREFRTENHVLTIHTDARTPKVEEMRRVPGAECVFWDKSRELQLRLSGHVSVHAGDALARSAWESVDLASRFSYLTDTPPGDDVERPTSGREGIDGRLPTRQEAAAGWDNFAVLVLTLREIDWVLLDNAGHRRARFTFGDQGLAAATWLVP